MGAYQRGWLRADVVGGLTVAAYLIPQVMAYAGVAGLPAIAGLWATVPALTAYFLFGTSRRLSMGPESSTALLSATIVAPLADGNVTRYAELSAALALVLGVYCLIGWLLRVGFLADLLSRPVLVGYMAGLAGAMLASQLGRITGAEVTGHSFISQVRSFSEHVGGVRPAALAVSLGTVAFVLGLQARWRAAPGPLFATVIATVVVFAFDLDRHGVATVGHVAASLPAAPSLPSLDDFQQLLIPALGLLAVGFSDTVCTARAFAARDTETIDANQELFALGVANLGSGVVHGFPVSSSASRTALGVAAGARTQLHSAICAVLVLLVLGVGRGALTHLPYAALGGLVVYAALRLVDVAELRRLARFRRNELLLALGAAVAVLATGLLYGVLIAVGLSVAEMLSRIARPHDAVLGQVAGLAGMHDIDDYPQATQIPGLLVYRYDSPLFFANAEDFKRRALAAVDQTPDIRWFILNVEANVEVDITALDALESLRATLTGRGIVVALARVKQDLLDDLQASGLAAAIGSDRLFPTLPTALAGYDAWRLQQ